MCKGCGRTGHWWSDIECPNYIKSMQKLKARITQRRDSGENIMKGFKDKTTKKDINMNDSDQEGSEDEKHNSFFQ